MIEYKARIGAPFSKKMAQIYGERLEEIKKKKRGKLDAKDVVQDARNKTSPFHNYFEWNDGKAAEQYRIQQARELINHVVEVVIIEGKQQEQRSFFSVCDAKQRFYVSLKQAITTKIYRKQLLKQLEVQLENALLTIKMLNGK